MLRLALPLLVCLTACAGPRSASSPGSEGPALVPAVPEDFAPDQLLLFDGADGAALSFAETVDRACGAQVIVLGENHDDALGHGFQRALVEAVFDRHPGSVLALEMLERDEQVLVEDFQAGILDAEGFARETNSARWSGEGSWDRWYQPIIDAALEREGTVVAANAPRRYVRAANRLDEGWIDELSAEQRALFDLPVGPQPEGYRQRFFDLMGEMDHGMGPMPEEQIEAMFASQSIWDATMAVSVVGAEPSDDRKVVLLVGGFHMEWDGGLLGQIAHAAPEISTFGIRVAGSSSTTLDEEDFGRADVVVYTPTGETPAH